MKDKSEQITEKELTPLANAIRKKRGAFDDFVNKLCEANGRRIQRQQVQQWLDADPTQRRQPRYGIGRLMLAVGREMKLIK